MPENLDLEQKPPDTKVKARQEIYWDVLHLLKLEVQKHRKMLELVRSLAREEAKRAGKLVTVADAEKGFFEFLPWDIEFTSFQQKKTRHTTQQDWSILEKPPERHGSLTQPHPVHRTQAIVYEVNPWRTKTA